MKPGKRRESIENSKELIELSWELIGLRKDIGMEIKIEDLEYSGPDNIKIGNFINQRIICTIFFWNITKKLIL